MIARLAVLGVALAAFSATATTDANAKPLNLKMAYFGGPKSPTYSKVLKPWTKRVSNASKGTVDISTFPGGALGRNPRAQVKLALDGVADVAFIVPSYTPGRFPDNAVMELPGIVKDTSESSFAIWGLFSRGLLRGYDKFKVFMLVTTDPYTVHTKAPIKSIADLRGKKLRAGGPVAGATIRALGAIPVGMPIPAVAQNISKGVIQGSASDWTVAYTFRIIDVAKYHYMGLLGTVPIAAIMSKKRFDALPADARAAFEAQSGLALVKNFAKVNLKSNQVLEAKARKTKGHTFIDLNVAAKKKWDATVNPVINQWVGKHPKGKVLLSALREELAKIRKK